MADNFTTNLNLDKPIVSASADTWGTSWNANADTLDAMLAGVIFGLTLSTAGSSGTFGIAAGAASGMALASAYTKTTGAWAVGTGNGGLDTGSIANSTWYHVFLIQRLDTGVVDVLFSLSATSPTMPTNYTRKRRVGSMLTNSSAQWVKFSQKGDEFLWDSSVLDWTNITPPDTSAHLKVLTIPTGVQVRAVCYAALDYVSATCNLYIKSPDQGGGTGLTLTVNSSTIHDATQIAVRSDTNAQVSVLANNVGCQYQIFTQGWFDRRGQDS